MPFEIDRERLVTLLESFSRRRVGVVGDFTLDGYWYADMAHSQLSRETPLHNRPVTRETYTPGGAANLAWNLAALRPAKVLAFTVFGPDWRGELFRQVLVQAGVDLVEVLTQPAWLTPFFGKVMLFGEHSQQEDARLDFVNTRVLIPETERTLVARVKARLPELDALIVADYQTNGVITPWVGAALNQLALEHPDILFLVDSRERVGSFKGMGIKPNQVEASRCFFPERAPGSVTLLELGQAGIAWQQANSRPAFITLGEGGCLVCDRGEVQHVLALPVPPPLDTVGSGDTFLAGLAAGLTGGASPLEAACLATLAAAVTIRKLGVTGTASPEEILDLFSQT